MSDTITVKDVVDFLLNETRPMLEKNKSEIIEDIETYLDEQGFMGKLMGVLSKPFMSNFLWRFLTDVVLPFSLRMTVFVLIRVMSSRLGPFAPMLIGISDVVDEEILPNDEKKVFKGLIKLMTVPINSLPNGVRLNDGR